MSLSSSRPILNFCFVFFSLTEITIQKIGQNLYWSHDNISSIENCAPLREYVQGSKFWILVFVFLSFLLLEVLIEIIPRGNTFVNEISSRFHG